MTDRLSAILKSPGEVAATSTITYPGVWMTVLAVFMLHMPVFSWGPGHDDIQKAILERLPPALTEGLDREYFHRLITHYSHYPDSFEPFEEGIIGEQSLKRLRDQEITRRYDLHHDRNRAAAFIELVYALRENDMAKANFWIACLAHSAADMAALNHDPVSHTVYYLWGKEKQAVRTPKGNFPAYLDIREVVREPLGQRLFGERIDAMQLDDAGEDLPQVLAGVMFYGHEGSHFLAVRGFGILEASVEYADNGDHETLYRLFRSMSELGAWAVVRILRDVQAALRIAASDISPEIPAEADEAYQRRVAGHMRSRPLDDGMFTALFSYQAAQQEKAIGILAEPSWRMNDGLTGFTERVLSFQIANTLRRQQKQFRFLDVRKLLTEGLPDPEKTPLVILPVRQTGRSYYRMKVQDLEGPLKSYLDAGGKVIWIGGDPPPAEALPQLAGAMVKSADPDWPVPAEEMIKSSLSVQDAGQSWSLKGELKPKVGWRNISCPYLFDNDSMARMQISPFLNAGSGNMQVTVGAFWPAGRPAACFLAGYTLAPFLWTEQESLPVPVRDASLDEAGEVILRQALLRLLE